MRALFFASLMFAAVAIAQEGAPAPEAGTGPREDETAQTTPRPSANVSDGEKVKRSQQSITRMRDILKEVLVKLEEARNSRDVVKLNCVNEKLTQVKGLLRISEQADVAMQEAIARKEAQAAEHEFTKVSISRSKIEQLRAETESCIGQLAFRTDENILVEVEEPEGLPDDPTRPTVQPTISVRPPPSSPTR